MHDALPQLDKDFETLIILVRLKLELPWTWTILESLPIPYFKRFVRLFDRFEAYADTAIAKTKRASKGSTHSLFSRMIDHDGKALPDQVIRQEAVNIVIAGSDSMAITTTFCVYAVLADKTGSIRRRLLDELQTCSENPSWTDLEDMQYLNQIVQEILRLYAPIGDSLPRVPSAQGATLGPYHIPADTCWSVCGHYAILWLSLLEMGRGSCGEGRGLLNLTRARPPS